MIDLDIYAYDEDGKEIGIDYLGNASGHIYENIDDHSAVPVPFASDRLYGKSRHERISSERQRSNTDRK